MPVYDYQCCDCSKEFEEWLPMAERKVPEEAPCAKCGGKIKQILTGLRIGDSVRLGLKKNSGEFNEIMNRVKRGHPKGALAYKGRDYPT